MYDRLLKLLSEQGAARKQGRQRLSGGVIRQPLKGGGAEFQVAGSMMAPHRTHRSAAKAARAIRASQPKLGTLAPKDPN